MAVPTIRVGIAGSGFAASYHFECALRAPGFDVQIAGVYSSTKAHRIDFAEKRGIRAFDSYEELLSGSDVVHLCVPTAFHESMTIEALERGVFPILEKPFTGYFAAAGARPDAPGARSPGDGARPPGQSRAASARDGSSRAEPVAVNGDTLDKAAALEGARRSVSRMLEAEKKSDARILYAENWVYAPAIQKEREIVEKTGAQLLWIKGEESHSGSHSAAYGSWELSGGGVMLAKGCHPLTAALYLKSVEGRTRNGTPIRPRAISARAHAVTRSSSFRDAGFIRTGYRDIDDLSMMHVIFEDDTVADIVASDLILGGIQNRLEVAANNHRTICNINPSDAMKTYNPAEAQLADIYIVEKLGTKQGWMNPAPDEDWITGYPSEIAAFYRSVAFGEAPECDSALGSDTIMTIYAGYVSAQQGGAEVAVPLTQRL